MRNNKDIFEIGTKMISFFMNFDMDSYQNSIPFLYICPFLLSLFFLFIKMLYSFFLQVLHIDFHNNNMIRVPLTFHSPEAIHEFLEHRYGTCSILIKKGQALVTFHRQELNERVVNESPKTEFLKGQPLRIFKYVDGDLERKQGTEMDLEQPKTEQKGVSFEGDQFLKTIKEATTVTDPNDPVQVSVKGHFKDVIEYVAKFDPLYNSLKSRHREILAGVQGERLGPEFLKNNQAFFRDVKSGIQGLYKKARNQMVRFGKERQRLEIDLQPSLQPEPVESVPINAGKLRSYLHFSNKDKPLEVKKLAILNERQFVCTNFLYERDRKQAKGKIKVYNMDDQFEVMGTVLNEGAYGLAVVGKYLLVGNLEGSVSFWNATQGTFSSDHPFQNSQKLHDGYIFDLLKNGTSNNGFGVVTLGLDFKIKLFDVSQDFITDDIVTLFFKEQAEFNLGRQIMSIDLMQQRGRLIAGSYNKIVTYDLPSKKVVFESTQRSNIYRLKRMQESLVVVANTNNVSFADPRLNGPTASCPLSQEVKALCVANENVACYGTADGEVGMVDLRKPAYPFWRDQGTHHSRIYDILRMGDRLISGDQKGLLVGWSDAENK